MRKKPYPGYAWKCEKHNTFGDGNITCAICGYPKISSTTKGKIEKISVKYMDVPYGGGYYRREEQPVTIYDLIDKINQIVDRLNELERTKQ